MLGIPHVLASYALCAAFGATAQISPVAPPATAPTTPSAESILFERRLDGSFDDWRTPDRIGYRLDRVGDAAGGPDIFATSLVADPRYLWIYLEFLEPVTLQGLDIPFHIYLDVDPDRRTGATGGALVGADLAIVFSPQPEPAERGGRPRRASGEGVEVRALEADGSLGARISPETIGLQAAPTHASRRFELRLDRSEGRFGGLTATMRTVFLRSATKEDGRAIVEQFDSTDVAQALLPPLDATPLPRAAAAAIARAEGTDLRVLTWNAELGAMFKEPEPFAATLRALAPDVILLQELGKATREELVAWLDRHLPGAQPWEAVLSGGDLRVAVAARGGVRPASFLDGVQRSTPQGNRDVRVVGGVLESAGRRVLALSLHLKCCGRLDSDEDRTRRDEVATIRQAIADAHAKEPFDAIVVGGDFNLVGDRAVLESLSRGLDLDGSDLDLLEAYHLSGLGNSTWRSNKPSGADRFLPSRLDFLLTSGSSLEVRKTFVFSEEELAEDAASGLELPASALRRPSDHQAVVGDLVFRGNHAPPAQNHSPKP